MGGTWTQQNKKLPGAYINIKGEAPISIIQGDRGTVAIAMNSDWGNQFDILRITSISNTLSMLGLDFRAIPSLNEILKNASKVIAVITSSGVAAKVVGDGSDPLTFTANKAGVIGNKIQIVVERVATGVDSFNIYTYLDGQMVDRQIIGKFEDFKANAYVTLSGDLTTAVTPKTYTLAGGTTVKATSTDFLEALRLLRTENFNVFVNDSLAHADARDPIISFVKELREKEGIKVQSVLPSQDSAGADYEGILEVANGVILDTGVVLDKNKAIYWVAGATAGASINQSNTGKVYQGAIDASPRLTRSELEKAVDEGRIVFKVDNNKRVTVVYDINTLLTFLPDKKQSFRKNRVMRVLDNVANDINMIWEYYYMGKIDNNDDGRKLFKGALINYFKDLEKLNAIENFTPEEIVVEAGQDSDAILVVVGIQVTDSGEKLYMTVTV
jgi:hypothetical protein